MWDSWILWFLICFVFGRALKGNHHHSHLSRGCVQASDRCISPCIAERMIHKQHTVQRFPGGVILRCSRLSKTKRLGLGVWHVDKFDVVKFNGLLTLHILPPAFSKIKLSNNQRETSMLSNSTTAPTVLWNSYCFPLQGFGENQSKCSQMIITTGPNLSHFILFWIHAKIF